MFERRLRRAARRVGGYTAADHTPAAVAFDRLSVAEWLDRNVPGGSAGLWGRYVWAQMALGVRTRRRPGSAPSTSSTSTSNRIREPTSATTCAAETTSSSPGSPASSRRSAIELDSPLEAVFERAGGGYGLRFAGAPAEVVADRVVLAIPFTTLRRVDSSAPG